MSKIVVDTSVIINGKLIVEIEHGQVRNSEIIIPQAVFDELQSQASNKKDKGFVGLEQLKKLQNLSKDNKLSVTLKGIHPSADDIKLSGQGRIDSLIIDLAKQNQATLYTSDKIQSLVAQAEGIETVLLRSNLKKESMEFLKFFDETTMSVHLKQNQLPLAKKGKPGSFILTTLSNDLLSLDYLEKISSQILDGVDQCESDTIEISKTGAIVVQYDTYRIAITYPPFSESYEITIVHPIVKLSLQDYEISDKLMKRFKDGAEGIVISGAPGSGKSTLASGLSNFYYGEGKIVKTFESPRDLQVESGVTQYSKLDGSFDNAADILLLVRPDYTVFDEVRRQEDFRTFADLRLTGVGMVGVVHANSPLDAIQRFIGKIELGIIPNVLDTVIFVQDGSINKIYDLTLKVKVPSGMTESDLARPVIEIRDFENNALEHEIYTFGEENVIVPVLSKTEKIGIEKLAEEKILDVFRQYDAHPKVEFLSDNRVKVFVAEKNISSIIGKGGSNINDIEKYLKIHIDILSKEDDDSFIQIHDLPFSFSESKTSLIFNVSRELISMTVDIHVNNSFVTSTKIGKKGQIRIPKRSDVARTIMNTASSKNDIHLFLQDM